MYPSKAIEAASAILFQRRQQAVQEAEARRDALYARVPPLREHHRQLRELAQELAVAAVSPGGLEESQRIMDRIRAIQDERKAL